MGISTSVQMTCDYAKCRGGQSGPRVIQWLVEEINQGAPVPDGFKDIVSFEMGGRKMTFCSRLHAAIYFLPEGYEAPQLKKIQEFPDNGNFPQLEVGSDVAD